MSSLYLIRHGQAGRRGEYDALSDLGHRQAYLLGQHLAAQKVPFKAMIAGCLNRQRQTADEVWRAYREAGIAVPDVVSAPSWNEFDMTAVFSEFAPLLCEADPQFKHDYQELLRKLEDRNHPVHQAWTDCDTQTMRAWMEGRYPCRTESWAAFRERILSSCAALAAHQPGDAVAIFTSAAPISICATAALGVSDDHFMRLAAVIYNSAVTTMRLRDGDLTLFSFNGVPHLLDPQLRTFR
ncbi:MAG TPA: histidine phosphatase family protein [Bryobacteraceae bacterium]|nr:histidine phosphatase family protein [Bryobacteraceae bacterium]